MSAFLPKPRRSRHSVGGSSVSLPKLPASPFEQSLSRREKPSGKVKHVEAFLEPSWTADDEVSTAFFEPTGKIQRPAYRHSVASTGMDSVASSVSFGERSGAHRTARRSDISLDSTIMSAFRKDSTASASSQVGLFRSASVPLPMLLSGRSGVSDSPTSAGSTRYDIDAQLSPCADVIPSSSIKMFDSVEMSFQLNALPESPRGDDAVPAVSTARSSKSIAQQHDLSPANVQQALGHMEQSVDSEHEERSLQHKVAYLSSLVLSESRCRQELEASMQEASSKFADTLKQRDAQIRLLVESHQNELAAAQKRADARVEEVLNKLSMADTKLQLSALSLIEREDDLKGHKDALLAAQEAQRLQLEQIQRMTALNAKLQNEIVELQRRNPIISNPDASVTSSEAPALGAAAIASSGADGRRLQNEIIFLRQQVNDETLARKEAEAACQQMEALLERMSQKIAEDKAALEEKERSMLSQVEKERKDMAQSVNECDRKLAETRAKYDAKLSQLEFDNERKVIAAVALETSKIDSLIQIALDRAETRHRQEIKATAAAAKEACADEVRQAHQRVTEAKAALAEEMSVFQQHQADLMMEFSKQHQEEAQAASYRLRVITEKKEAAETQLTLMQRQHAEICAQLHDWPKKMEEKLRIAAEDAQVQVQSAVMHEQQAHAAGVSALCTKHETEIKELEEKHAKDAEATIAQLTQMYTLQRAEALASQRIELEDAATVRAEGLMTAAHAAWHLEKQELQAEFETTIKELNSKHESELEQARNGTASALHAMCEEREAERAHMIAYAQEVSAKAVSDALAEAEAKHEEALHNAEFLFEKRIAAKMVEMMEANAVKQAAAVEKAAEASKKKAEIEFAIVANDLRTEMQKLVVTYDRALDEASVMQARAEQRAELYASDLAGHKAIDEKNQRLVISLRKDNAKLRLRQTLLFAKVVSLLSTERAAAKRSIELLTARSVHAESVAQDLMEVKKTLVLTMEANRIDAVTEHKHRLQTLQSVIKEKYTVRSKLQTVKDALKRDMATIDGSINATEREIREFANVSAIREGGVDLDISRKKRRLNAELDSLLDKMQSKREEFLKLDAELQALEAVIEAHEAEQREAEAAFTVGLVQQLQHMAAVLQSEKAQSVL